MMIDNGRALMLSIQETTGLGKVFVESGFFADTKQAAQAVVKILAGRELGFGPVASMAGIYIVKGRIMLSATLMAARIKASGRYDYRVKENSNTACEIEYLEKNGSGWAGIGISRFTMKDATDAQLANGENWRKYPRNMLMARAMSNGAKWYCPDLFSGAPIYTPEEMGIPDGVNPETGEVIESDHDDKDSPEQQPPPGQAEPEPALSPAPESETQPESKVPGNGSTAKTLRYSTGFPWRDWCNELARSEPYYNDKHAPPGKLVPDTYHIRGTAKALGFDEINPENANEIKSALVEYAAKKYAEAAAAQEPPTQ